MLTGCQSLPPTPGSFAPRRGDEIVVAGQFVHTGTRVVLWMDPGGYDAYRVERRFAPIEVSDWKNSSAESSDLGSPNRYNLRKDGLTPEELERVRGGGWDLAMLQKVVDQFVIHYDASGTSRQCFNILHDHRDLSVHFMLDIDGTIYQTLDVKERAWHAGAANSRSVGIEIANIGAYAADGVHPLNDWYRPGTNGETTMTIPERFGDGGVQTPGFVGHPAKPGMMRGEIHGQDLVQYDFTPQQYDALIKLTATLCKTLPRIECRVPLDASGKPLSQKLSDDALKNYHGVLGHYHLDGGKVDPGPAFDWDRVIRGAQRLMNNGFTPETRGTTSGKSEGFLH